MTKKEKIEEGGEPEEEKEEEKIGEGEEEKIIRCGCTNIHSMSTVKLVFRLLIYSGVLHLFCNAWGHVHFPPMT